MERESYIEIDRVAVLKTSKVRNKTLLDIGIGSLAIIAARDFNCNVISIDIDKNALEGAREEVIREGLENKISLGKEDATNLSYYNNKFDLAISYGALHHIPLEKRKKFISELYRVSKEKIIVVEYNELGFPHSEDEYKRVDLDWLENELKFLGMVDKYSGKEMNLYICFKEKQNE
jgi:cyclopropane fatty-acyl-phospholipid synthase-like methyltransferase